MLWRRAPRAVYRVYGEDEYLDAGEAAVGEDTNRGFGGEHAAEDQHTAAHQKPFGLRLGRLVGIGLLVGVTVCAFGLVVGNVLHRPSVATRSGFLPRRPNVPASYAPTGSSAGGAISTETKRQRMPISRDGAPAKTHRSIDGAAPTDHKPEIRALAARAIHASGARAFTHPLPAVRWTAVSTSSGTLVEPDQTSPSVSSGSPPEAASLVAGREFGFEQ
jgi:hypothetical protein